MTRIVKKDQQEQGGTQQASPKLRLKTPTGLGQVIDRQVQKAKQQALQLLKDAELDRKKRLEEGKKQAAAAKEEALATAAKEAFLQAAKETIALFARRQAYLNDLEEDMRILLLSILEKILGVSQKLPSALTEPIFAAGIQKLRLSRQLKMQLPPGELQNLKKTHSFFAAHSQSDSDIYIEEANDISSGLIRIVTDAGSFLCSKDEIAPLLAELK